MSRLRVIHSAEATSDLLELESYIAERDGEQRADRVLAQIDRTIDALADMPGLGRPRLYLDPGTLAFPSPPWIVFYTVLLEFDAIRIIRIVDGRRDLPAVLGKKRH